ncbi:MAG: 5-formyltetrahydrofolate cyclo-ligase [Candidatus Pacebacteria bacterium]|nr:5-formyltetrahydrofolate cyclo-ligase [Candidatus Paceibacterota bacterium]
MNQHLLNKKTMEIIEKKKELRAQFKLKREQLGEEEIKLKSQLITKKVLSLSEFKKAKNIMCYVSKDTEVFTHALIKKILEIGKTVSVPFIVKRGIMKAAVIKDFSELVEASFETLQPQTNNFLNEKIDLNLVPALAVSKKGERLGWGAGFYDRFISDYQPQLNLALIFDCQFVEELPATAFDQKIDGVMTESQVLFIKQ